MTSPLRLLPITALLACGGPVVLQPPHADRLADDTGDAGTTHDSGEPGSVELGDGGSAGTDEACTLDDLSWDVGVRPQGASGSGSETDELDRDDIVVAYGSVSNPCDEPVVIDEPDSCLVRGFDLVDAESGEGRYQALDCYESTRQTELDSGDVAESAVDWGLLVPGDYLLTAHFAVDGRTATTTFIVR